MNEPCSEKSSSDPSYSSRLSLSPPCVPLVGGDEASSGASFLVGIIGSYVLPCGSSSFLKNYMEISASVGMFPSRVS